MTLTRPLLCSALLLAAACGPDLRFERDPAVPIPAGSSWAWSLADDDGLAPDDGAIVPPDSIGRLVAQAIETELVAHGFPKAGPDSAAFIVHFHLGRRSVTDTLPSPPARTGTSGGDPSGMWGGHGQPEDVAGRAVTWEEGMLIVDVLPRDRRTVAWRGVISGEIRPQAVERPNDAIQAAVRRLLRDFPED